jgi:hypothetical protein
MTRRADTDDRFDDKMIALRRFGGASRAPRAPLDCVLPAVPIRQIVLSLSFELSRLAAIKPDVLRALARIHAKELARHYKRTAKLRAETSLIAPTGAKLHAGAVTFVQRFGSSLNLHVHLHTCALDGVYIEPLTETTTEVDAEFRFLPATSPTRAELQVRLERIACRVMIWLSKRGYLGPEDGSDSNDSPNRSFAELLANIGTQRGTVENLKDATGERDSQNEPAAPFTNEAVTHLGLNLHASLTLRRERNDSGIGDARLSARRSRYGEGVVVFESFGEIPATFLRKRHTSAVNACSKRRSCQA